MSQVQMHKDSRYRIVNIKKTSRKWESLSDTLVSIIVRQPNAHFQSSATRIIVEKSAPTIVMQHHGFIR